MAQRKRRGFTIVELVIVIAVIAILAGVLIPTFVSVIKKANEAKDISLIKSLNTSVLGGSVTSKPETMHDALEIVKADGFDVEKIKATATGNEILWDKVNNCFVYIKDGNVTYIPDSAEKGEQTGVALWKIIASGEKLDTTYSNYLAKGYTGTIVATTGIDVGENVGLDVTYNGAGKDVVIRTNGGKLIVNDSTSAKQYFYGTASEAEVTTGSTCMHVYGKIANIDVKAGKVIAEEGSIVVVASAETGATVAKNGGIVMPKSGVELGDNVETSTEEEKVAYSYEIATKADLLAFRDSVNGGMSFEGLTVKLTADIDMVGYKWLTPIGVTNNNFVGTFDGQGHTISNLSNNGVKTTEEVYISSTKTTGEAFGLFGKVKGTTVLKNFNVSVNAVYDKGQKWAAVVDEAGEDNTHLTLEGIVVSGYLSGYDKVAGIIAESPTRMANSSLVIKDCVNEATVIGGKRVAGIMSGGGSTSDVASAIVMTNVQNKGNITCTNANSTPEFNVAAGICAHVNTAFGAKGKNTLAEIPEGWSGNMTLTNVTNTGKLSGMYTSDQLWYVWDSLVYKTLTDHQLIMTYRLVQRGSYISDGVKNYLKENDPNNLLANIAYSTDEEFVCKTAEGRQYTSLQYALAKNSEVILLKDMALDYDISSTKTIDLGGHTLTINAKQTVNGSTLTFKNGTIVLADNVQFFFISYNGTSGLTLNAVTLNASNKEFLRIQGSKAYNDTHRLNIDDSCNVTGYAKIYGTAAYLYYNGTLVDQTKLEGGIVYNK